MARYEISISPEYVGSWTVVEAVRELFQNALDQQALDPENVMTWGYTPELESFWIASKNCKLNKGSLLLGASTKADDNRTIGQFGEGYKLAALVLCRTGHTFTVQNNLAGENWNAKIIRSKKFQSDLLVFDANQSSDTGEQELIFEISGITPTEFEQIKIHNLHICGCGDTYDCRDGSQILLDDKFKGGVYVSGLFVRKFNDLDYGYNFTPQELTLYRDRRTVDSFDLYWSTSRLWLRAFEDGAIDEDEFSDLVLEDSADLKYCESHYSWATTAQRRNSMEVLLKDKFEKMFGDDAVPVETQSEVNTAILNGYKPVIMGESSKKLLSKAGVSMSSHGIKVRTLKDMIVELSDWVSEYKDILPEDAREKIVKLSTEMMNAPKVGI